MRKKFVKMSYGENEMFGVIDQNGVDALAMALTELNPDAELTVFESDLKFEDLPKDVQDRVKETLKAYDRTYVTYENGKFTESPAIAITATYAPDYQFCGEYRAKDIYTKEERRQNFIDEFGYEPFWLK